MAHIELGAVNIATLPVQLCRDQHGRLHGSMLEVFSGQGNLSVACEQAGLGVAGSIDIRHGPQYDLTRTSTQNFLAWLVGSGIFS